ncbi:protein AHNAK2 [Cinclus cinclus]|uniref:protein AHNAK2 n=1 Tax=Cinclus cinclus TaxID=127875 RepID=UPI002E10E9E0
MHCHALPCTAPILPAGSDSRSIPAALRPCLAALPSSSGRQLRPAEPPGDADAVADADDEDSVNEVAVEDVRPRPQGSSPVYEYPVEEDYLKLQEENKKHSTDKSKQSHPQETMEVTLKTEVEAGASGFSVKGGGNEGIFIKRVLKESPASKIFSLREGDQLLSATIFFDNIKYEDALKILQYSEPYRVQFSLKRKIAVQEDLEHSTAQHTKERIGQEKELSESIPEETLHVSGKTISEEDRETLIVSQRIGRSKRAKKDRLSWPKFQSIKNKKILRHRRSHSTSDAYEPAIQDISPTSTDTESQYPQEVHTKEKKVSQRKLKFPSIGFRMHRSKPEPQEKKKKEIKTTLISETEKIHSDDISLENPEILTVEYTTSPAYEMKRGEKHETLTKDLKEIKNGIPSHVKQCPEVEISIKKEKDKEATSEFSATEIPDITIEIPKPSLEAADLKVSPTKKSPQASSKSRKKKQKGTADKRDGESGINIDLMGHTAKGSVQVKGLEICTAKAELQTSDTLETGEKQTEEIKQMLNIQKMNYGISVTKRKETETDTTKQRSDILQSELEKTAGSQDSRNFSVKTLMTDAESEVSTWKVQMPSFKVAKAPKTDKKIPIEENRENTEDMVKKEQIEEDDMPTNDKVLNLELGMKRGEKDIEGKESKFRLPKLKFPTFTWSTTKEETAQPEEEISTREVNMKTLQRAEGLQLSRPTEEIMVPSAENETGISIRKTDEQEIKEKTTCQIPSQKIPTIKTSQIKINTEEKNEKLLISKTDREIEKTELNKISKHANIEITPSDPKSPKVHISLPSVDVSLPQASVDLQAPEATLSLEGEAKVPEKEAAKTKDGKFKMPKFGMPSFGWSSSREAKGTVAAEADVSLKEPHVAVPSGAAEVDVTLPGAEVQAPGVEVTVETAAISAEGEKGRFKMPDVKMPSVKLPKVKAPQAQVSLPKAEVSLPKGQEGDVALPGPEAEASLEVAAGKAEGGGMKIHMPKVKVPSVVFSKPTVKAPKVDADVSLPQAELKAADVSVAAPDVQLPSVEGSLDLQAPDIDLKTPSTEGKLELEGTGLKAKLKMPKFDKPKFSVSSPKAEAPAAEVSLPSAEVDLPSAAVTAAGEGPALGLKADIPGAKTEGAGLKLEKPSLKMPKADIKAPKVDISLPSVDVSLPQASVDLQAPEATLSLEGEAKVPEKEAAKTKDGKFKMPKFGMPSFGWSSSREAKGTVAAEADVSLKEPHVAVPSGAAEVDVTLPGAEVQAPGVEVTVETAAISAEGEKGRFKMPDVKMPSVKLPKVKAPQAQVSLPKAEVSLPKGQEGDVALPGPEAEASLEVAAGKAEGGGMKIHMPKVKVPSVVFSKPTVKAPKVDADVSLPQAELKAADVSVAAPDVQLPSVEGSLELQAPDIDLKTPSTEGKLELEGTGLKAKLKMPKFDKPKFSVSSPKAEAPAAEVSLPSAEVDLPSAAVTAAGEGPALGLKADIPGAKTEGAGLKLEKPSLKMPKADIKAPKVDISLPSVDVSLPQASVDFQVPEATLSLEGEAKVPEKEAAKTKDGKFKMPKFGMPSFGWSSSREAKGTVAAEADVSLKEPHVAVPSGAAEVDVTLPGAEVQAPGVEVTVETAAISAEGEKGRFKMPDVKMPSVKLPKVKAPQAQVSLPKAEVSLPKGQEGDVALPGPEAEASLEVAAGKAEGGGMKIHMPKVKVPSVVFSKPTVKAPKVDADVSLPQAELKAADVSVAAPDVQLPSVEGSLDLQAPDIDLKTPSTEGKLELEGTGLKAKLKMPKFDKPKFSVSSPKAEAPAAEVSLPSAEVDLPSAAVTAAGEGPALGLKADIPGAKTEGAGLKLEKPSLKMPKADIKAPKVDISLPSVDVSLPQASVDLQAPEATLSLEGEAKVPEKEAAKTKDGKFKMPKFGMPSFGWSSSREAKGTVAAEADVSLKEPHVAVPSGAAEVDVTLPGAEVQAPGVEVTVETAAISAEGEKGRFKMPDVKMPSVKLPKVKAPQAQVSLPKAKVSLPKGQEGDVALPGPEAEASLEVAAGKAEGGGMKIHMPKVKVPSVVFSKPTVKAPKVDADVSLPQAELKAADVSVAAPDVQLPSVEGSLDLQAPDIDLKTPSTEGKLELEGTGLKAKLKMPKFDKPKFSVSSPKAEAPAAEVSLPSAEVDLPSAAVTAAGEGPALGLKADIPGAKTEGAGLKLEKPSLKMPKADIKAPKVDISLPSVDVSLPQASVDFQVPEATLSLEGEAKVPEKEAAKTKDGKFKMPKFGMPSFGWSSSREAKGTVAAEADVSLKEPHVAVPSGAAEVDVTLPGAEVQAPGVEVTVETAAISAEGEKGRFKMPDVKMPSVKLPKVKAPQAQVSLPKAEVSLPKGQEGDVALPGPEAEASLEVAAGKAEGGGMKIHMPKVKVPSVVFSKPTVKAPKVDADVSLPQAELKAADVSVAAPDVQLPSVEGSLDLQAPDIDLKTPSTEGKLELEGTGLKAKLKMPKFDKPKFSVSSPKAEAPAAEVSLPSAEVDLPSAAVTAAGEGPALGLKADIPGAKTEGAGLKLEKPSLKMPKADIKAPKVDISLPSVDVSLPQASVDLQAPEATLSLEGEAKVPEKEAAKTKDGKFKMPKFGMPSFGWSSSREAKGTVAAEADVSLKEPHVAVPSGAAEVDVTLPGAEVQAPGVEVTVETAAISAEGEKGRFKMPDVKMPSVKLPKVKAPQAQVSLPKAEVSLPKGQEGDVALPGPEAEASLEVAAGKAEGGGMKIHMPKVKVPSVVFSKPTVKAPKVDADVSLPQAELKAANVSVAAPDVQLPSVEGSLDLQAPDIDLKTPSTEGKLELEGTGLKAKLKMPKFDKPKFSVSSPKAEAPAAEVCLPSAEVDLPSAAVTAAGEGPALGLKADIPGAKTEGAGLKLEKPSLKMPKADIKAPKVDISLPSVDVSLPQASVDLQAPEATLSLEGEAKVPEKEAAKTKDGKFKMPKFGMPSFGWSSSREAKGTVAAEADVSLKEPHVAVPSGAAEVDVTLPGAEVQAPGVEVTVETAAISAEGEKGRFKMPDVKMPSVKLPKVKAPQAQVSLPKAEVSLPKGQEGDVALPGPEAEASLEVAAGKAEGGGMKIHMPKVKVPSVVFSKPTVKAPKVDADVSLPQAELKAADVSVAAPDVQLPSVEGSLDLQAPDIDLKTPSTEGKLELEGTGLKAKLKMPKFDKPKFSVSSPKAEAPAAEVSLPSAEVDLPSAAVTAAGEGPALGLKADIPGAKTEGAGLKLEKPSLKMPKADIKAPKVDISLPSVDVSLPQASVDLQAPEATLSLEGEAKVPEKEAAKTKDGKFKMPKFGMPSFGWSSSREAKGTVAAEADVSLKEPHVAVPSGAAEVDVTLPGAEVQAPGVEVTVETAAISAEGEKGRFKMPDVKMPSVKLPKVKAPQAQVSLPKAEVSLPKGQEGDVALPGPEAEASLEVAAGKAEGGGMKIHMPKVKVPSVVFSKPTVKAPKVDADVSLPQAELKAADVSVAAPDVQLPSVEGSLDLQAPDIDLKTPSTEGKLELEGTGLKAKLKMPKFDKPKFSVSSPKAEAPAAEVSLPSAEADLPSAAVTAAGEGPALGLKADIPGAKTEGAGLKLEKPSLKMPKADIKAPKVDISLPSVDVSLPQASVDLQAPEATLSLEGEAKVPEKEAAKTKDGKFKMPKFGMPSFGWSSSREAKGTVAAEADVSLKEPHVAVPSGAAEVDVTLPGAEVQAPGVEVTVETATISAEGEKGRFKMPDVKMPSVKLPKVKAPQAQVSLPKAEVSLPKGQEGDVALPGPEAEASLEVAAGKAEGGGMKIHMPKVKVPSVVFSKPTVKAPKVDADVSLPQAELKAADVSVAAPDVQLPSVEGSLDLQAPDIDLKTPSTEGKLELEGTGLKAKLKMPKFDKPKFSVSSPKAEAPAAEVSLPRAEVDLPSAAVTAAGEGPALGLKADIPGAKTEGAGLKLEKPSLKMPKADIKAPKVDISLPSVDVSLPQASVDLQAPEATLSLEGEAKVPEKEAAKTKDGKFKMPKFGMPSFGWSSSREAKGTVAAEADVSLKEPHVAVPSGAAEVDVTLPGAEVQAPGVEVTVETAAISAEGEKGRFKMPDVKMPSVKLPKVKAPQAQVSLPKAEVSLPKGQEGDVALPGPEAEASLEVAAGKAEGGGMKIHMPKVKVPSVVFSKPTVKAPKVDADVSLPQAELKAADVSVAAPDVQLPSVEGSLELQAPDIDLKTPSTEGKLELEGTGLKAKLKMPKFDKPKFSVSSPKAEAPAAEVSLPSAEVDLPSAAVTAAGEGPALGLKADIPGAKTEGAGLKLEKPSLKMPKADIKAPKVDISLPSVDVSLPQASVDLQAPEATLSLEGEAKVPEKEAAKTKDGKFKMPKFGMPSFGWSSSREAKGTVAAEADVSLKEPHVAVPSGAAEVDVTLPGAEVQAPGVEVTVETAAISAEGEKGRFKMPDVKMPSVKLPKVKAPQAQVSLPKAEVSLPKGQEGDVALPGPEAEASLEVAAGKAEGGGMKIHMPKVKVPSVVFSKPTVKAPKVDADVSLPQAELKAADVIVAAPDVQLPSVEGSLDLQAPDIDLKTPSTEGKLELEGTGLKAKLKMPKFDKPKFSVSSPKAEAPAAEVSLPSAEVDLPSAAVTAAGEGPALGLKADIPGAKTEGAGLKLEKPSLKMPKADIKAPKVDISLPSVDVSLPQASVDFQAPEATLSLEGEAKVPEKEAAKTKDGKFKMPKFGMPSFGWSSSREAKGTVVAEADVSLKEPHVAVPSGAAEVDVTLPGAEVQAPGVEVTVETAAISAEGEKGRFKMPDVKMPSVKLPKVKAPQAQVSLPKAEVSLPKGQEGDVALPGPEAEASLEVAAGKAEGGGMKIHMPKVKVPSVVFSKPTVKAPKVDADVSLPQAELKAADVSVAAPDVQLPSVEGSLDLQAPDIDLKTPSTEGKLELEGTGLKAKLKMPKFDKPKFSVSSPKAEAPAAEVSLPSAEVDLPSAAVTAAGEGPALGLKADIPGAKTEGAGLKLEKPSLKMPKADIKAPKVDISLPSVDVSLPQASVDFQAPEATLSLEGEAKVPEKEAAKTKDGKFKMPKFGMPSFGWSSSREAKGTVAAEADVSLKEPHVAVPSGAAEVDVTLPGAEVQAPGVEVTVETAAISAEGEKGRFKMPDVKMPSVKLPKVKAPQAQVSLPKAEVSLPKGQEGDVALPGPEAEASLEVAAGKAEGGGMKIHMPKVKVPSVVFSKPTVKAPKVDADVSLPQAELKAADVIVAAPDVQLPSVEGSLDLQAPDIDLKTPSTEGKLELEGTGLKAKLKMPKFDKPKFSVSSPKAEAPAAEVCLPSAEVDLPSTAVTAAGEGPALGLKADIPGAKTEGAGLKLEKPSLKMPKADIKAPKVDISLPSVDVSLPQASVDLQAPEATLSLEGEAKVPEKEAAKTKDGKFKMPRFGMPSFGWSSSREAKGTVAAEADVSLKEPHVAVPSGAAEVDVTLPGAEVQAPGVEVTVETAAISAEGEKGRFKMPDVKMPSVKLPKVKAPQAQVSLPKAEVSLPKGQEGDVTLPGPEAEASLEVAAGKAEGGGMKIHMPKVKVPSVVFSKPTVKAPKVDADVSLPQAELKAADVSVAAPDVQLPSVEGSLDLQAPDIDLKTPSTEGKLELEGTGLKAKLKMPKFDKPKFSVSSPKAEAPAAEVSLPRAEVDLPSAAVTAAGEGPALGLKADIPGAKTEGAGLKLEKPSLKMPKADIKAPKVDISLPSVDVSLPQASVDLQAPEATLSLEGEAKVPEKEAAKTKDGKFKMPKFGMPSFGWSSSREAKGTVATEVDVSLKEPHVAVPSGAAEADLALPGSDIQEPCFGLESSTSNEVEIGKCKSSVFRMPKISFSKGFKSRSPTPSAGDVSVSETLCYTFTEYPSSVPSESVGSEYFPDVKGEIISKSAKFRVPSIGFSKAEVTSPESDMESSLQKGNITLTKYQFFLTESESKVSSLADENLSDFEILNEDASEEQGGLKLEGTTPAEIPLIDTEVTVKIPKFRKPKFRIRSKGKATQSDTCSSVESEISKGRITSDMTDPDIEKPAQISDTQLGVKLHKPSLEVFLDAPTVDPNLSPMEVTLPKLEAEIHGPDLECKAEQEVVTGEKGTEEKENKFKSPKFKLPSFRWSPKKEAVAPSHIEEQLEGPTLSTLSEDMGSELTFPSLENQYLHDEFDTIEKDGEKAKTKKSQFTMPKISFPKIKGQKVQVSPPVVETDAFGPKQEKEGVSVQISEKGSSGEGAGLGIKVPKVTVPTLEFSKPEIKAPKIEMDISIPTGEVIVPTCEEDGLTLKSAAANASLSTSDIKTPEGLLEVKSPDVSVERTSSENAVGDVEIKAEGSEGKTKMSKFQMPKVGITFSKGKGSEKDVGQSKSEVKVPQLKAIVEMSDIAVEAPDLEVKHGTEMETYSPEAKITKTDSKASEADVLLPSADISIPKPNSEIQESDVAVKIKGEIKQDGDGEEKEGHFKMPKFKLPSFSWSPKKEASVKSDSGANLEDRKLAVMTSRIDTEVKETATDDQGSGPDLALEISVGKVEQKSPIKKPQFVMPKISISKIKVPKSQSHSPKVGVDAALPKREIEGDDSIKIPDIEKSHPEGTEEGAQISIKLADTMEFSRVETEASRTEITVSSAKIDASLTPSEKSFQQVDLKINSITECNIQKTGIKLPKGEASVDLKSPDMLTESSSVVDGRKIKLEGPEGKIKMPKFQKTKFGISLTKGKVPETEINSPKIEAELPQLRTMNEIADIAVGVPASELTSDMPDSEVVDGKIKTPQVLTGGTEDEKVDISTQSVSKPVTEGIIENFEKEIKLKEREIKAEEVQTEEYQGWFKMPKFRIPAFSRSSLKEKKNDVDTEKIMEKAQATIPAAKVQTEISIPENTFSLPHGVVDITVGKEGIQKFGDSVKGSDVSLPKMEGDTSLSTDGTDSRVNIPKTETYADVVKRSAEGHTSEITVSAAQLSKSYPSASETDKDKSSTNRFPTCTQAFPEHKGKSQDIEVPKVGSSMKLETSGVGCKPLTGEITLDATQKKRDVSLPKEELDSQNKEAASKKGKIKGEVKIIGKDSEESQLKRTICEWSTTKGSEDGTYVTAKMEDLKVEVPTVQTDVRITEVDAEMKFQVKSVEKHVSAGVEVQVEDRAETSKIKAYKFKIPKFGMLHSEIKGFEDDTNLLKSEADSAPESERGTAEMQLRKPEGSVDLKSPALDHSEASTRITGETVDQTQGVPEVSVRIPKLKIPRFTFRTLPIEADVLLSKVATDPKGSSTDIEIVQLEGSSAIPEEAGALKGGIQKAKSKILTLTEPDIKTAQMTATMESSLSSAGQDIHWSYIEGQEVSEKVEPEHVAIERCEIYTTEILKGSEILSSEVKTATLGFSLLKTKLPESHSDLDVLVQQPSPTGGASVRKPTHAGESFGVAAQRTGSAELGLSDKPHHESEESRGKVSLTKLKTSAEVKCSSKLEESFPDKAPEGITAASLSKDEDVVEDEEKDITNEKEKTDSKRSPGRFKFWLPNIGFSSSGDETSTDAKPEIKKSVPEDVKPADTSDDSSKQADKTGWFRFPKLGFTSPSKKAKSVDKEEVGHKEGSHSDEDSPTDKPDVFFDAQESLSPKEIGEGEKAEIDGASSIVTSSARTELILLEEEKDSKSNIVGDTIK